MHRIDRPASFPVDIETDLAWLDQAFAGIPVWLSLGSRQCVPLARDGGSSDHLMKCVASPAFGTTGPLRELQVR